MATIEIDEQAYNYLRNDIAAYERALMVVLERSGRPSLKLGNVKIYLTEDSGVGAFFVDEKGERLDDLNYVLIDGFEVKE